MGFINVDEIKPGMVLGSNLFGPNGRFILAEGTILEDKHLQIFKTWGVTQAHIKDVTLSDATELQFDKYGTEIIDKSKQLVSQRFVSVNLEHEAMAELYRLAILRTAELLKSNPDEAYCLNAIPEIQEDVETLLPPLDISEVISKNVQFASLPDTFIKVSKAINDPLSSSAYIAKAISADIALSAKLLKLVNSAFYGIPQRVESLSHAVTLLGTKQLGTLAMGIVLIDHFKGIPGTVIDMKSFWHHSISCGIIARLISDMRKMNNSDSFWVAGLLHDVGRLIFLQDHPGYITAILAQALKEQKLPYTLEPNLLGFSHAKIASLLFEQWNFSLTINNAVQYHHSPQVSQSEIEPAIIHLADIIAHAMALGKSGNPYVPPLTPSAWEVLEVSKNDLATIIIQADYQINTLMDIFMS